MWRKYLNEIIVKMFYSYFFFNQLPTKEEVVSSILFFYDVTIKLGYLWTDFKDLFLYDASRLDAYKFSKDLMKCSKDTGERWFYVVLQRLNYIYVILNKLMGLLITIVYRHHKDAPYMLPIPNYLIINDRCV